MGFTREKVLKELKETLAQISAYVEMDNESTRYDINREAEDFFAGLLNYIGDRQNKNEKIENKTDNKQKEWKLHNANVSKKNEPGFDLIDEDNRIVVQITSTNKDRKINESIKKSFMKKEIDSNYRLIILLIVGKRKVSYKIQEHENAKVQLKDEDIWDSSTLCKIAEQHDTNEYDYWNQIGEYLNKALSFPGNKRIAEIFKKKIPLDRTKDYEKRWTDPLFMSDFSSEQNNITLQQLYEIGTPWISLVKPLENEKDAEKNMLDDFPGGKREILLLGEAGAGKTSFITYFINTYKKDGTNILVYSLPEIFNSLNVSEIEKMERDQQVCFLFGKEIDTFNNTILFLESLDELELNRGSKLDEINILRRLFLGIPDIVLVFVCRSGCLSEMELQKIPMTVLEIADWKEDEVRYYITQFAKKIGKRKEDYYELEKSVCSNIKVFGKPLNLYMVLSADLELREKFTESMLYEALLTKVIENNLEIAKKKSGSKKYFEKEEYRQLLCEIAYWMFRSKKNSDSITMMDYENLISTLKNTRVSRVETAVDDMSIIGNFLVNNRNGYRFIHNRIYEFLIADQFCKIILDEKDMTVNIASFCMKKPFSKSIMLFVNGILSERYKEDKNDRYDKYEEVIREILENGMFYEKNRSQFQTIEEERDGYYVCFRNLCYLVQCIRLIYSHKDTIFKGWAEINKILSRELYIRSNREMHLDLRYFYMKKIQLPSIHFKNVDLRNTYLEEARLEEAHLERANLEGAILSKCNLNGSVADEALMNKIKLQEAELSKCKWQGVHLSEADLTNANLEGTSLNRAIMHNTIVKGASFQKASLEMASIENVHFEEAILYEANLDGAWINDCVFSMKQVLYRKGILFRHVNFHKIRIVNHPGGTEHEYSSQEFREKILPQIIH